MKIILITSMGLIFAGKTLHAEELVSCDVRLKALSTSSLFRDKRTVSFDGGNIIVDKKAPGYITSNDDDGKVQVKFRGDLGVIEEIRFEKSLKGYTFAKLWDPNLKRAQAEAVDHSLEFMTGFEERFEKTRDGKCLPTMSAHFMETMNGKKTIQVGYDKKYCDSIKDVLRQIGRASFDQCDNLLQKAHETFMKRREEPDLKGRVFGPHGGPHPTQANSMEASLWAIHSCAPDEWTIPGKYGPYGGLELKPDQSGSGGGASPGAKATQ